jgi:RimJ/RimL family protein N-acetyltransferase
MTLAVQTIIHEWGIPHMNVRHLKCYAFAGNEGSLRVFEKNNFERGQILKNWVPVPESRGGGRKSIILVKWRGS